MSVPPPTPAPAAPPTAAAPADDPAKKYKAFIDGFLPTLGDNTHESRVAYLYLDSRAHLTVGIGHLVARHENRSDRATIRAGIAAIFNHGFTNLQPAKPVAAHGKKTHAAVPGPKGAPKPAAPPPAVTPAAPGSQVPAPPGVQGAPKNAQAAPSAPTLFPPATIDLVTDEAVKIMAMDINIPKKPGHTYGAGHYQSANHYALTEAGINSLGFDDVLAKIKEVKAEDSFSKFDDFPDAAKQAVIDLAFQHGAGGLAYHKDKKTGKSTATAFAQAVAKADWALAAKNVPTDSAGPDRTNWRRKQLNAAAPPKPPPGALPGQPSAPPAIPRPGQPPAPPPPR